MSDERIGRVFSALGDGTRRDVVARLTAGSSTATELARELPVSRQAIAKHLATLEEAGLVASERVGKEMRYRFVAGPLAEATSWIASTGAEWDERLARLKRSLERGP